jgi:hypothetical protein
MAPDDKVERPTIPVGEEDVDDKKSHLDDKKSQLKDESELDSDLGQPDPLGSIRDSRYQPGKR